MPEVILNCFEESRILNENLPIEWQSHDDLDELEEFLQFNWEQKKFYRNTNQNTKQQYIEFLSHKNIRTNNYIGTIVFKGQQLNIYPKIFRKNKEDDNTDGLNIHHLITNIVQWLNYCSKSNYPFVDLDSEFTDCDDLKELFINLYIYYVEQIINQRAFYRYEDVSDDLSLIKGHIDFKDYINYKIPNGLSHKLKCEFSEFIFDNQVNRIIKYTCKYLMGETISNKNKKIIRDILMKMNNVSDVRCVPADCDEIRLSNIYRPYSIIINMSKMFLLDKVTLYDVSNNKSFCFLFPVEELFEDFIAGFMKETLGEKAKVKKQVSDVPLIQDIIYSGHSLGSGFTMKYDIVVNHFEKGIFVLDTKYKQLTRFEGSDKIKQNINKEILQADLYQIIEYAAHRDLDKAYLLYPMYRFEDTEPSDIILHRKSLNGKIIDIHIVRLPFVFENDIEKTKKNLSDLINKIFL